MFVSGAATAYPQLYQDTLQEWMEKTQASDLCGEVISFITPVKSMHFNRCCELSCSNYGQSEISRLAVDAFDYESVHGSKPKVWVQMSRTARVKKILANKKRAAKEKPDEEDSVANDNPAEVAEGGDMVEVSESTDKVTKKTAPKKTTTRDDGG